MFYLRKMLYKKRIPDKVITSSSQFSSDNHRIFDNMNDNASIFMMYLIYVLARNVIASINHARKSTAFKLHTLVLMKKIKKE